jgi:polyisoprenoid-binding protein YceI
MFGLGAVKATFTIASSELLVADPVAASTVVVSVDAGSFRSDKSRRDDQVRSASLLDAATYPNITFTSDGLREQGAGWLLDGA